MKKINAGATADIYDIGNGRIFKAFHDNKPDGSIENEYRCTLAVQGLGFRTPIVFEKIIEDGRRGIVMERIDGMSMLDLMVASIDDPKINVEELMRRFARLHHQMHSCRVSSFSDAYNWLKQRIMKPSPLSDIERTDLCELLDKLPSDNKLCHLDFHPGNVICTSEGSCIIDWCDTKSGCPWMDVARTLLFFRGNMLPSCCTPAQAAAINRTRTFCGEVYADEYAKLAGVVKLPVGEWLPVVAASRLCSEAPEQHSYLLRIVRTGLHNT